MRAKVILNPYADRWRAQKKWVKAKKALLNTDFSFDVDISRFPGHTIELAYHAALNDYSPIIAAGGDGTIGEIVNGIMKAKGEHHPHTVGIIPLGTANDLAWNLKLPYDLDKTAKIIAGGKSIALDVGKANGRYFVNNSALGLEPFVSDIQHNMKYFRGVPRYLVAAIMGIARNPVWEASIKWETGSYDGPLTLLSVGNAPRTGGFFYMAPHADPHDGKLSAVIAYRRSALSILSLLPKTMSPKGTFLQEKGIQGVDTNHINIELKNPSPAHCDGDLFSSLVSSLAYSIVPKAVNILYPQDFSVDN